MIFDKNEEMTRESISNLDSLWNNVKTYRSSETYKKIMEACARFKHLAPYNALLVEVQKPGAMYVLSAKDWYRGYQRKIKPNARPLIILVPFGPVEYVFDIADTYPGAPALFHDSDDDILEKIAAPYKTKKDVSDKLLADIIDQLKYHGIAVENNFIAGPDFGAQIELLLDDSHIINFIRRNDILKWRAEYLLSVNSNAKNGQRFASICHELGHLFCHHLPSPKEWKPWNRRNITHAAKEFEAESVSWLVCERLGIGNPSEAYLSNYLTKNQTIPDETSIERILSATKEILELCEPPKITPKKGLLYKRCERFKQTW